MRDAERPGVGRFFICAVAAAVVTAAPAGPAGAQMLLPGAVTSPQGAAPAPVRPLASPKTRAVIASAPAVPMPHTLAGRTLVLDGAKSQISLVAADKQVAVGRLSLAGTMISNGRADCRVQAETTPIAVTSLGRPLGLERLQVGFPACPIVFDVLDGALLGVPGQAACEFREADCRVEISGLWGPPATDFTPARDKEIERARGHAEAEVRANYKALVGATKDRPTVMGFARQQAQFSSTREETCRGYAGEGQHGYCAMKLTEARAAELRAEAGVALAAKAARLAKKHGRAAER